MAIVFRLRRGDDLLEGIQRKVADEHISAGYVACCVGCVTHARLRDASGVTVRELDERLEIVSLTGTVGEARCHLHVSFSREDLSTIGGHLMTGCIVNTTAEIVLERCDGLCFGKAFDPETGYDELVISQSMP